MGCAGSNPARLPWPPPGPARRGWWGIMAVDHGDGKPDFAIPTVKIPLQPAGLDNVFSRLVRRAEECGYERVWNVESTDRDVFGQSALMVLSSSIITVGTDIA